MRNKILLLATYTGNKPSIDYAQKMGGGGRQKLQLKNIKTVFINSIIKKKELG
jgi:hypothetical protein